MSVAGATYTIVNAIHNNSDHCLLFSSHLPGTQHSISSKSLPTFRSWRTSSCASIWRPTLTVSALTPFADVLGAAPRLENFPIVRVGWRAAGLLGKGLGDLALEVKIRSRHTVSMLFTCYTSKAKAKSKDACRHILPYALKSVNFPSSFCRWLESW